ncbi:MAG TPA: hypothetical protein VGG39_07690 [Polyangiaceae bacterium]
MKPLSELTAEEALRLRGLLFDLDDTLLTHGLLTRDAFGSLWELREAGLTLVAVTGRPSAWGTVLARQWPLAGCVTENGAIHVVKDGSGVSRLDLCAETERRARRLRLTRLVDDVRAAVPEARLTDDVEGRVSDVTWDIGERSTLPDDQIASIIDVVDRAGARWLRSSVHLHATFDSDDKATGGVRFLVRHLAEDPGAVPWRYGFVGDSGNDAACFAAFWTTFGVANVRAAVPRLSRPPRYVANHPMGLGFAEVARAILSRR